jgi:hypothetical protein
LLMINETVERTRRRMTVTPGPAIHAADLAFGPPAHTADLAEKRAD